MKMTFLIKKKVKDSDKESLASIYIRFIDGKDIELSAPSKLEVSRIIRYYYCQDNND